MSVMKTAAWLAAASLTLSAGPLAAETLQMQTFLGANASTTKAFETMAAELAAETGGEVTIVVLPGKAVVGATETIDAINNGLLQGQYTAPTYFAGKDPAMAVLGDTLAAYPDSATRDRWFTEGGGLELARQLYDKHGLYFIGPVYWPPEQIPSVKPIRSVADFEGLKMRAPGGMPSDLLTRAGASLVTMGVGESVNAMETGVLDATDLANIGLNVALGMHNKAKNSTLARHSMAVTEVSVDKEVWDSLSPEAQAAFEAAVAKMSAELQETLTAEDAAATKKATEELGVTIYEFGPEDSEAFRALLLEVWDDWSAKSPDAKAIVDSHKAFMKQEGLL
ncbi:MAG: TRAP transporter substrate-binding protein [Rhodospirillales bacterium]